MAPHIRDLWQEYQDAREASYAASRVLIHIETVEIFVADSVRQAAKLAESAAWEYEREAFSAYMVACETASKLQGFARLLETIPSCNEYAVRFALICDSL